jgi:hypothetical protein
MDHRQRAACLDTSKEFPNQLNLWGGHFAICPSLRLEDFEYVIAHNREPAHSGHFLYSSYIFDVPTKFTRTVEYIYYYVSNVSHMFRRILHHPKGEFLVPAQNRLLIVQEC